MGSSEPNWRQFKKTKERGIAGPFEYTELEKLAKLWQFAPKPRGLPFLNRFKRCPQCGHRLEHKLYTSSWGYFWGHIHYWWCPSCGYRYGQSYEDNGV